MPMNIEEWNLSNGDVYYSKCYEGPETYQDFIEGTPEEDPEEDLRQYEERAKKGAQ